MALFADAVLGQSLSIIKNGPSELLIEAEATPNSPYVLQASENLHLWVDVNDEVAGRVSNRLDITGSGRRFFRLIPWTPPPPPIRLVLLGDSTVGCSCTPALIGPGWSTGIFGYFKPMVHVVDFAGAAYSTKIFLASEQKPQMLAIQPDFVLVQFGMVDAWGCDGDPDRCITTLEEYADNLRTIVETVRGFNGTPILITPPVARFFDETGKVLNNVALQERVPVIKAVAAELQTHLIDLNRLSTDLFNDLGESASAYISRSSDDMIHFSPEGAKVISGLIVNELPDSLGPYLVGIFNQPPKP